MLPPLNKTNRFMYRPHISYIGYYKTMTQRRGKSNIAQAIASKSKLTQKDIAELDKLVKKGIAKEMG